MICRKLTLAKDTGVAFRGAIADVLHVTPEELHEMLKKHTLSSEQQIAAFNAALDKISGPGGVLYKHRESLTQGLMGIHEQFIGHWRDFQESFGKQIENFLQPIADKVFHILTPSTLTHAFKTS